MTTNDIIQWIKHPELLNTSTLYELRTMVARYPYFQTLRLLYLKNLYLLHDENFGPELRRSAMFVPDRKVLFYLIEGEQLALKPSGTKILSPEVKEEGPEKDRTLSIIDNFLAVMPDEESTGNELDLPLQQGEYVLTEENVTDGKVVESATEELDDGYFTETLAKIYIKQHRYAKALEIIRKLNLKYPKKSIYFADQIRFLEKLVINEKTKS
ncbi:MAG: tetratricopeptide repeat protein [Bacteroidaceae bacterium]|nr:tetratricopeptide repeat protein [Bacteroidaceae bacterium]